MYAVTSRLGAGAVNKFTVLHKTRATGCEKGCCNNWTKPLAAMEEAQLDGSNTVPPFRTYCATLTTAIAQADLPQPVWRTVLPGFVIEEAGIPMTQEQLSGF
jgi:hypothetical protein